MLRTIQNELEKAQHLFSQQGGGLGRYFTRSHEFSVYWLQEDKRSTEEFERLPQVKRVCVSQTEKNQVVKLSSTPSTMLRWPLTESCLTCWNSS